MDKLDNAIAHVSYIFDCLTALRNILEKVGQMVRYNCPFYVKDGGSNG